MVTYALGFGNVVYIAVAVMIAIGIALTLSPVVYQSVEKIQFLLVRLILLFLVVALIFGTDASGWKTFVTSFSHTGQLPPLAAVGGAAALLGAIAYAGAGGTGNLAQSNWVRDKGLGMGAYIPRIVSPITGEERAAPALGYAFPDTPENLRRWRGWWRIANIEQFFTFFVLGCLTLIIMSVLAYVTVFGADITGQEFAFLRQEGQVLGQQIGTWFKLAFFAAITTGLFSTEVAVIDYVGRMTADSLKVSWFRGSEIVTESRIYYLVVWLLIVFGCGVLLAGLTEPLVLLIISAATGGAEMFIYAILLIIINRRFLPTSIHLTGVRLLVMFWAVVFYGFFSIVAIVAQVQRFV